MDDLIKILQKLMAESPKPKGGIADTAEGIEFIGRKLTKDEIGSNAIIGSKLTDASRFKPFSIQNVGIENRYSLLREYGDDLAKKFEETIQFIKDNPDVRFSQIQKDNILYNLGVYRRVVAEKDKIAKGLTEQGKNVDDIFNKRVDNLPEEMLTMNQVLEKFQSNVKKMKEKLDELKGPSKKELDEKELRLKRLYDGPGYDNPNSSLYRGYGSFFLSKLHDKGIIKLDDEIYKNLVKGAHHYGGADFFAPDPVRIWRKHFGNEVFEKLDNFKPDNEDIFQWLERNNIQPIQKDGPKNALEYMTSTEVQQRLADETSAFGKYKNPESAGDDAQFFYRDKPEQRMERITYHGENISALEQALQTLDPDSYKEYFRTKPRYDSKILPFKELNAEGGRVGFGEGSEGIVGIDFASAEDKAFADMMKAYRYYLDHGGKKSLRDYMRMATGAGRKGGGRELFRAEGGRVGYRVGGASGREYDRDSSKKSTPSSPSFDRPTMADVAGPSQRPASIGPVPPMQTIDIEDAKVFDIEETGDPALNPFSQNVEGGIDYTPSFTPPTFFEEVIDKGTDFVTTAYNNPLVRLGLGVFLPTQFQKLRQLIALKNVYDRFQGIREGDFEAYEDLQLPDAGKEEIQRILKEGGINRQKKSYKDILKEFELPTFSDGGRVNFRIGSDSGKDISGRDYASDTAASKSVRTSPSRDTGNARESYITDYASKGIVKGGGSKIGTLPDGETVYADVMLQSPPKQTGIASIPPGPGRSLLPPRSPYNLPQNLPLDVFYMDKIIRDNMDFIKDDMSYYFDPPEEKSFLDSITDKDIFKTYDEREGYISPFTKYYTELYPPIERLPKDIPILDRSFSLDFPFAPEIGGLLESFDASEQGVRPFDVKEELPKEYEV